MDYQITRPSNYFCRESEVQSMNYLFDSLVFKNRITKFRNHANSRCHLGYNSPYRKLPFFDISPNVTKRANTTEMCLYHGGKNRFK